MTAARIRPPGEFRTLHEEGSVCGDADATAAALIVNPAAPLEAVLAAIESRVQRLHTQLLCWTLADDTSSVSVREVVGPLEALAEEAEILVNTALDLARRAGKPTT